MTSAYASLTHLATADLSTWDTHPQGVYFRIISAQGFYRVCPECGLLQWGAAGTASWHLITGTQWSYIVGHTDREDIYWKHDGVTELYGDWSGWEDMKTFEGVWGESRTENIREGEGG